MDEDRKADSEKLWTANLPKLSREINGTKYTVTRLGWWGVGDVLRRLNKILGPSVCALLDSESLSMEALLATSGGKVGSALTGALERILDSEGRELQEILGGQTAIETTKDRKTRHVRLDPEVMDIWFSQTPKDALPWLAFALEVQLKDFFERLIAVLRTALKSKKTGGSQLFDSADPNLQGQQSQST